MYQPFWQDLYDARADLVLNGHTHGYERFAPQTPTGAADTANGLRQFVVGTGGVGLLGFTAVLPNEVVRQNTAFGVLKLVLHRTSYDWRFLPIAGSSWTDVGSGTCHAATASPSPSPSPSSSPSGSALAIVNGGFEAGSLAGWTSSGVVSGISNVARTGAASALLGSTSPTNGLSSIAQSFTAPAGSSVLSFWWQGVCPDSVQYDWATASLQDSTSGTTTAILPSTCASSASWAQVSAPVTAGHRYTLTLSSRDDDYAGDATYTRFDDVSLSATSPPSAPTGLAVSGTPSSSQVALSWNASTDANGRPVAGYRVYRNGAAAPLNASLLTGTSYTDRTVGPSTSYGYRVTAVDGAGAESALSSAVSVTTAAAASPSPSPSSSPSGSALAIVNGGFEAGSLAGWTSSGVVSGISNVARTGAASALLGSTSPTNGLSSIAQSFTAPAGSSVLSFWWQGVCPDSVQYDWATASLQDSTSGTTTAILPSTCASSASWAQVSAPVTAGHRYTLTLSSRDDDYAGDATYTRFDDVSLS